MYKKTNLMVIKLSINTNIGINAYLQFEGELTGCNGFKLWNGGVVIKFCSWCVLCSWTISLTYFKPMDYKNDLYRDRLIYFIIKLLKVGDN